MFRRLTMPQSGRALLRRITRHRAMAPAQQVWSFVRHRWVRESVRVRLARPAGLFQPLQFSAMNRYPQCFAYAREALGSGAPLDLLSFGCATGEEAFTLAHYFPDARIKGIDINPRAIAAARARTPAVDAARIEFATGASADGEPEGRYDAVFAFAVFRHSGLSRGAPRCDHLIRFADFERAIAGLARSLKPGGLLFIRHAHFRFADTASAAGFDLAFSIEPGPNADPAPVYGRDDRLIAVGPPAAETAWRKR